MKIYIGNLPEGGHIKEDVQRLFSRYGEAWDCVIIKEYGFIHMKEEAANKAIKQLDGFKLEGKRIRVEKSIRSEWRSSSRESKLGERKIKEKSMQRSSFRESKEGEKRTKEEKAMKIESKKLFVSNIADETTSEQLKEAFETCCYVNEVDKRIGKTFGFVHIRANSAETRKITLKMNLFKLNGKRMVVHNNSRMEMFNPVSDDKYSRIGGLGRNNILPPFSSARDDDFYCNRLAGAGLGKSVGDDSFKRRLAGPSVFRDSGLRLAGPSVFRDSGLYALGNSVGNCSCNNLCGLSRTVCGYNCGMLGGCKVGNDGRFNRMAGDGHHRCNKPGGFNTVGSNNLDGFGGTVDDVCGWSGCANGCKGAVNECNSLSDLRNTVSDTTFEGMCGVVVKKEKDMDIKMKIKKLNKTIKTEEGKPLINERLVNDRRNQVNYLERKIQHLETEKTENQLRSQVKDLQKRVRDLQEEKKIYKDQNLDDNNGRSLLDYQNSQRSSKANKRVKQSRTESSSKRGCSTESKQKQSSTIGYAHETGDLSDDDIQIIDDSDEEEIKIIDEREEDVVEIVSQSKLKQDNIFKNRGRDDNENNISENEVNEVEILTTNGSKRRKSSSKDGFKNRMLSEKFDKKGAWGVVKSERGNDEDIPLICLDDEEDVKDVKKDKDDKQVKIANESMSNSSDKGDHEMLNMSDGLGEVLNEIDEFLNEIDDERPFQGVPTLNEVLGVPHHDAM